MRKISKIEAEYYEGDGYSGQDYPMPDTDINFAVIKVHGRTPKSGYQMNTECKELLYILSGTGRMTKSGDHAEYDFKQGDLLIIEKGEQYSLEGEFEAAIPCTPAWTASQHKYIA